MASTIKIRRSAIPGAIPTTSQLSLGELGINTFDGKLFLKRSTNGSETGAGTTIVDVTKSFTEKSTIIDGDIVNLDYNTGNVAICTNPSGPITLNVIGIPTDSSFDNRRLTFSVIINQGETGYACSNITLNSLSKTILWSSGIVSTGSSNSYDIFNFVGVNTVGSANTTENYTVFGLVNSDFR